MNQTEESKAIRAVFEKIPGWESEYDDVLTALSVLVYLWETDSWPEFNEILMAVNMLHPAIQYRVLMTDSVDELPAWDSLALTETGYANPTITEYATEKEEPHQVMVNLAFVMKDNYKAWVSDGMMPDERM